MYKVFLSLLVSLALLLYATPVVLAHEDHPTFKYDSIECNGKQVSRFWVQLLRVFAKQLYLKCVIDGKTITISGNLDTSPLVMPTHIPTPQPTNTQNHNSTPSPNPTANPSSTPPPTNSTSPSTQPNQYWHEPGAHDGLNVHEHGDKPPVWADEFSQRNFGHPVMFGGDEATPNENIIKHQAFKGFLMQASGVEVYVRYHNMSNPHDRSGAFHSYEIYAKDMSNNVSFWQGWEFVGYPEHRSQRSTRRNEFPGLDPHNGINWPGRGQFIVAAPDLVDWKNFLRCEQWYKHGGLWAWDVSVTICGASTYYTVDEHTTDVANPNTWHPTGEVGGSRRLEVTHYGPQNPRIKGADIPYNQWFCVQKQPIENRALGLTPNWKVGSGVTSPTSCPTGFLPQYVADSFPKKGVYFETGNTLEKSFPTQGVTIPN